MNSSEWYPANSTIGPYTRKNYSAIINISNGTRNVNFQNAIKSSTGIQAVGPKIYAFRLIREGQYIMDNLGQYETLLRFSYKCPPKGDPMYQKLHIDYGL